MSYLISDQVQPVSKRPIDTCHPCGEASRRLRRRPRPSGGCGGCRGVDRDQVGRRRVHARSGGVWGSRTTTWGWARRPGCGPGGGRPSSAWKVLWRPGTCGRWSTGSTPVTGRGGWRGGRPGRSTPSTPRSRPPSRCRCYGPSASPQVASAVSRAHVQAVAEALGFLEDKAAVSRQQSGGVRSRVAHRGVGGGHLRASHVTGRRSAVAHPLHRPERGGPGRRLPCQCGCCGPVHLGQSGGLCVPGAAAPHPDRRAGRGLGSRTVNGCREMVGFSPDPAAGVLEAHRRRSTPTWNAPAGCTPRRSSGCGPTIWHPWPPGRPRTAN